jgi:excinuclease ABC subunit B
MYADQVTDSMQRAVEVTLRRRQLQMEYNEIHGIVPQTIKKGIRSIIEATKAAEEGAKYTADKKGLSKDEQTRLLKRLEKEMQAAAKALEFEQAAYLRDIIIQLKSKE